ncbi:SDR family oxidoreductase [Cytophagaceae bacterium ABcell3]|nr:SDR family oxidoreductase [Cytophagaceae bacterium ABcell3]
MNLSLSGKRAMVCGSTSGIGKAAAVELALLGAEIVLVARNESKLRLFAEELKDLTGRKHKYLVADFNDPAGVKNTVDDFLADEACQIEILVNNTGGPAGGPIFEAATQEFENAFSAHLICNHLLVQALVPSMRSAGYGRVINIVSTSVKEPLPNLGVSNTIRAAVAGWAKTLSGELATDGITVNNVLPGYTFTPRLQSLIKAKADKTGKSIEEVKTEMKGETPANRFADPEEVAALVAFLATPAAAYVNGTSIPVDGGRVKSF